MFAIFHKSTRFAPASSPMQSVAGASHPLTSVSEWTPTMRFVIVTWLAIFLALALASIAKGTPPVEPLGVQGVLIDVPARVDIPGPEGLPNRVFRVDAVSPDMPAAHLRLAPGDMIVAIDSTRFTTMAGFRHALVCSSDRPSFLVWRARLGRLTIHNVPYPHRQPDLDFCMPQPPDSYWMSIDIR